MADLNRNGVDLELLQEGADVIVKGAGSRQRTRYLVWRTPVYREAGDLYIRFYGLRRYMGSGAWIGGSDAKVVQVIVHRDAIQEVTPA